VTDAAGNQAIAKRAITVAAGGGGTSTPPPTGGGTTTPPPTGGAPTTPPPAGGGTSNDGDESQSGDGEAPTVELDAPRSARARAKSVPVELTASGTGRVQLVLVRGARTLARVTVRLNADGTADHPLKLPKGIKPGRYTLRATYTPSGGRPISASRSLSLTGKPSARRASASSLPGAAVASGPRALPDGRFHGARPARTFKFAGPA